MFKILPDAKIKWKHVWLGSIVTGILLLLAKLYWPSISAWYPASVYGVAGLVILILLYSSMIFGAEFTAAYKKSILALFLPAIAKGIVQQQKNIVCFSPFPL
jgi:membrane protein